MRVFFQMSGGARFFPGLGAPVHDRHRGARGEDRTVLKQLVEETRFFELPARIPAPRGFTDLRTYEITIEDGGRQHTVALCDPVIPRAMHRLIIRLRELAVSTWASLPRQ